LIDLFFFYISQSCLAVIEDDDEDITDFKEELQDEDVKPTM
jgi:hypothetical protein